MLMHFIPRRSSKAVQFNWLEIGVWRGGVYVKKGIVNARTNNSNFYKMPVVFGIVKGMGALCVHAWGMGYGGIIDCSPVTEHGNISVLLEYMPWICLSKIMSCSVASRHSNVWIMDETIAPLVGCL
ncbi:hypothetical protein WN66_01725 [Saccharomyces cerevisiae]|nr:hypothetical protein WN66_01725 [Saccharomyces cerevisiae]